MGKKLPRAHEPLSFTLIIDEERVRKIMTSPDLFSFPQERSGERKNSLSLIHQISSSSPEERKKERKSNFKACSPNEEAPGVFPRAEEQWALHVNIDGNPTESIESRGLTHHHGCKSSSLNPLHSWEKLSWRGDSSLRKSRMKYGHHPPKRDSCDLLHELLPWR